MIEKNFADCNTKNVQIGVPLKYLSNFWRTLEIPLINCKISHILNCSVNCVSSFARGARKFTLRYT